MNSLTSLYIHFPFCRQFCNYCDFYKAPFLNLDVFERYIHQSLEKSNQLFEQNSYKWGKLKTLYVGGGTPSYWGERGAEFIDSLPIELADDCEFTLEANPGVCSSKVLDAWESVGVNRYSVGVQTLNGDILQSLNRVHSINETFDLLSELQDRSVNFSVDFMLGLPFSKKYKRDVLAELEQVMEYDPSHLSLYILSVDESYVHYGQLPDEDLVACEYLDVARFLTDRGYSHYEVSNFAKQGKESAHNLKYWQSEPVAALGPSATGLLCNNHENRAIRYKWNELQGKPEYGAECLGADQLRLEKFYMLFRTSQGIVPEEFFKKEDLKRFDQLRKEWITAGYLKENFSRVVLSSSGYLMMDSLMDQLFSTIKNI